MEGMRMRLREEEEDGRAQVRRSASAAKAGREDGRGSSACPQAEDGETPSASASSFEVPPAALEKGAAKYVYRLPPHSDAKGVAIACAVLSLWACAFYFAHFCVRLPTAAAAPAAAAGSIGTPSSRQHQQQHQAPLPPSPWWVSTSAFLVLTHLYMGLFVTAHDAMHGAVCRGRLRWLNDALGAAAITCYAFFSYAKLHEEHWRHHHWTGRTKMAAAAAAAGERQPVVVAAAAAAKKRRGERPAAAASAAAAAAAGDDKRQKQEQEEKEDPLLRYDPDYHQGDARLVPWFCAFMRHYSTPGQYARTGAAVAALMLLGAPYANLCVYMCGSAVLAAFQLFYWGTYRPHRPDAAALRAHAKRGDAAAAEMPWQRSRSAPYSLPVLFLQAYFFNLHYHHHRWPYCPWWDLPRLKREAREAGVVVNEDDGGEGEEGREAY